MHVAGGLSFVVGVTFHVLQLWQTASLAPPLAARCCPLQKCALSRPISPTTRPRTAVQLALTWAPSRPTSRAARLMATGRIATAPTFLCAARLTRRPTFSPFQPVHGYLGPPSGSAPFDCVFQRPPPAGVCPGCSQAIVGVVPLWPVSPAPTSAAGGAPQIEKAQAVSGNQRSPQGVPDPPTIPSSTFGWQRHNLVGHAAERAELRQHHFPHEAGRRKRVGRAGAIGGVWQFGTGWQLCHARQTLHAGCQRSPACPLCHAGASRIMHHCLCCLPHCHCANKTPVFFSRTASCTWKTCDSRVSNPRPIGFCVLWDPKPLAAWQAPFAVRT